MLIKIFTLPFSARQGGFDDEAVRGFMSDKEIVSIRDHFFSENGAHYWSIMLCYKPAPALSGSIKPISKTKPKKDDYRHLLTDESMPLFNYLREWRNERAKQMGKPPYIICNNKELAQIASMRPTQLNQLAAIEGIGQTKIKEFGNEILKMVASVKPDGKPSQKPQPIKESGDDGQKPVKTAEKSAPMQNKPLWQNQKPKKENAPHES